MISIQGLAKHYGAQTLFVDASVQFNPGNRYGLIGANGSGKSTLLRILTGEEEASEGKISLPRRARLGVLSQDHFQFEEMPIIEVVMRGHSLIWEAMEAKDKLLENAADHFNADRYQELEDLIMQHDGYALEARAGEILEGLAIETAIHKEPLSHLSGGFKLRVLLAQTLASAPDVLLLDEPTNHLDILSIRWLEKFLVGFKGTTIVVSHDHRFLNNICTHMVDVDYQRVTLYPGDYNAFKKQKKLQRDQLESEIGRREREIADHKKFIDRFKAKATKARQAKSKTKMMERIEIKELPRSSRRYPRFKFELRRPSGRVVVTCEGISKAFDKPVLESVDLKLQRGERIAIIGPNGIGKSTLLKVMMNEHKADAGTVEWGYETHIGYFSQDHCELEGSERNTLQSWLWDFCPGESIGFVRSKLALALFSNDDVDKRLTALSGGEAARLVFAKLGVEKPNVLVLDEPTNHLDMEGIEALVDGLTDYEGTILFVSHDRWFVSRLATRILELKPDGYEDFPGSYNEYLAACGDDHLDSEAVVLRARKSKKKKRN
jgi:ATPase subunit of ABC transporter with duplicated ATPase domains